MDFNHSQTDLRELGSSTLSELGSLVASLPQDLPLEHQLSRLQYWTLSLGLHQHGHASLEYRLRDFEDMRSLVCYQLSNIRENATELLQIVRNERLPFEQVEDESGVPLDHPIPEGLESLMNDLPGEMELRSDSIKQRIDDLYQAATIIRTPQLRPFQTTEYLFSRLPRERRAVSIRQQESDAAAFVELLMRAKRVGTNGTRDIAELGDLGSPARNAAFRAVQLNAEEVALAARVGRANTRRRQHFLYWESHAQKLARAAANGEGADLTQAPEVTGTSSQDANEDVQSIARSYGTSVTRREYNGRGNASTVDASEWLSTVRGPGGSRSKLPPPPRGLLQDGFFTCPYCFVICSEDQLEKRTWRRHVLNDMQPYMCTHQHCKTADVLYASRAAWVRHEKYSHDFSFRCTAHPDLQCDEATFKQHINSEHGATDENSLSDLLEISKIPASSVGTRQSCPFCTFTFSDVKSMYAHLAYDLEMLALMELPDADIDESESEEGQDDNDGGEDGDDDDDDDEDSENNNDSHDALSDAPSSPSQSSFNTSGLTSGSTNGQEPTVSRTDSRTTAITSNSGAQTTLSPVPIVSDRTPPKHFLADSKVEPSPRESTSGTDIVSRELLSAETGPGILETDTRFSHWVERMSGEKFESRSIQEVEADERFGKPTLEHEWRRKWQAMSVKDAADSEDAENRRRELLEELCRRSIAESHTDINVLIDQGADVNGVGSHGSTPLMRAVLGNDHITMNKLLRRGADVNQETDKRPGPLHLAAQWGLVDKIEQLLNAGADIDKSSKVYGTALYHAIARAEPRHRLTSTRRLLDRGANPNTTSGELDQPLQRAVAAGDYECVKLLLEHGAQVEGSTSAGVSPLWMACKADQNEMVELLLVYGANAKVVQQQSTPLRNAVGAGNASCARLLLDHGADTERKSHGRAIPGAKPLLTMACELGDLQLVQRLVVARPQELDDLEELDEALLAAIHHDHQKVIEYLVGCGADQDRGLKERPTSNDIAEKAAMGSHEGGDFEHKD